VTVKGLAREGKGGEHSIPVISFWSALLGVTTGRPHTFRSIAAAPRTGVVAVVLIVASLATGSLVVSRLDLSSRAEAALEERLGRPPTEAELELAAWAGRVALYVSAWVMPGVWLALLAFTAWALRVSWERRDRPTFPVMFSLCVYSFTPPALLEGLLRAIVAVHRGVVMAGETGSLLRANLRALLDDEIHPVLGAAAQSLDVFDGWWAILLAWALVEGAGLSRTGAVARVAGVMAGLALGKTAIVLLAG
jgi:hypothetical protein